jgi:hypothetical protein
MAFRSIYAGILARFVTITVAYFAGAVQMSPIGNSSSSVAFNISIITSSISLCAAQPQPGTGKCAMQVRQHRCSGMR